MLCSVFWPEAVLPLYQAVIQSVMTLDGAWVKTAHKTLSLVFPAFRERLLDQLAHLIPAAGLLVVGQEAHHCCVTCKRYDVLSAV